MQRTGGHVVHQNLCCLPNLCSSSRPPLMILLGAPLQPIAALRIKRLIGFDGRQNRARRYWLRNWTKRVLRTWASIEEKAFGFVTISFDLTLDF
jgi:hypothetical protein